MPSEKEGPVESVSHSKKDEADPGEDSIFFEYHVPLEDTNEVDRRPRTFYETGHDSSKHGDSARSFRSMDLSDIVKETDEVGEENPGNVNERNRHYIDDRFSPERNRKQWPHSDSQRSITDEGIRAPRRKLSSQSVSFKESADQSQKKATEDRNRSSASRHNSPSRLRMDGHVVRTDDDSVNINPMPTIVSPTESDDGGNQQENSFANSSQGVDFSFNTTISSPVNLNQSQNFSIASSDATFRAKPSRYSASGAQGLYHGVKIPEENRATNASFDESDDSFNAGTGFKRRFKDIFNFHTVSVLIVKLIPYICCLWCCKSRNELRGSSFPERFILARLNILSFFFSGIQLTASLWLIVVMFVEGMINTFGDGLQDQFNLWNNNAIIVLIGCFAFVMFCTCLWTTRIVKEVDLVGALRFLWVLLWILPIVAFLNITAFDFYEVTSIWIRHNWDSSQLWWFRNHLCADGTDESLCLVPIEGGIDYDDEDEWCFELYNSTSCTEIRDEAQETANLILQTFYRCLASWGFAYMFVMLLIIKSLERIISKPMVQKSREVNVVGWLTFPVLCTALFGAIILFSPYTYLDKLVQPRWVGYLYLITSGLFFLALLMGWFLSAFSIRSNLDKQYKSNAALILVVVLFINAFVLLTIIMASFVWSRNLNLTDTQRGAIACTMNDAQCTNCDSPLPELVCPEWSFDEIGSIVRRQLNQSAFMAAIFILYDLNVMVHGFNLRKHLSMYQIDYV